MIFCQVITTARLIMRITTLIFSLIGFYGLLRLINVEIYQFMPMGTPGPESGLIEAALAMMFGGISSLIALVLAFVHFLRHRKSLASRWLLAWCCLLILGFVIVLIHVEMDYRRAEAGAY